MFITEYNYYQHDVRKKKSQGGGFLRFKLPLYQILNKIVSMTSRLNVTVYQQLLLNNNSLPFVTLTKDGKMIFQQDTF